MGKLITQTSILGGTNGKIIRFADLSTYQPWIVWSSYNYKTSYNSIWSYSKDAYGWPSSNYQIGYSLYDSYEKWSKNTFYTSSPSNEASVTFPNGSNLITYDDSDNGGLIIENNRLITTDEIASTATLDMALDGSYIPSTASGTDSFTGEFVTGEYAPSIFIRYWSISRQLDASNNMRKHMPNLSNIYVFIDRLGTSGKFCQNWSGHNSLSNPLRIPIADFAIKWHSNNVSNPSNNQSNWYYNDDEHFIYICNAIPNLPNSTPFYAIIMFEVPNNNTQYFSAGKALRLRVTYNSGGEYSSGWLTFKASKIRYGNYMFDETASGYTDITGYSWGGVIGADVNVNNTVSWSSLRFRNSNTDTDVVQSTTGGWGT